MYSEENLPTPMRRSVVEIAWRFAKDVYLEQVSRNSCFDYRSDRVAIHYHVKTKTLVFSLKGTDNLGGMLEDCKFGEIGVSGAEEGVDVNIPHHVPQVSKVEGPGGPNKSPSNEKQKK